MYQWADSLSYEETSASRFFAGLTPSLLTEALGSSKTQGHTEALNAFRQRLRHEKA